MQVTDKYQFRKEFQSNWSHLVNTKTNPDAKAHAQYIIVRGMLLKEPNTLEKHVERLKLGFTPEKGCYPLSLHNALRDLRWYGYPLVLPEDIKEEFTELLNAIYKLV